MPCASPAFNGHLVLIRTGPRRWGEARRHPGKEELHHAAHVVGFDATLSGVRWRCGAGRARSNGRNVLKCKDPPMTNFFEVFPSNYNHHKSIIYIYNSCLFIFLLYLHYVQMLDELSWPYCDVTEMMVRIGASFPHGRKFQPVYQFQACECRLIQPVIVGFLKISDAWKPFKTHEIPYFLGE